MVAITFLSLLVVTIVYLLIPRRVRKLIYKVEKTPSTYEAAVKSLDRIENWTKWLTGLQTAAMAAMVLLTNTRSSLSYDVLLFGSCAGLFFGASIILSTWILGSPPFNNALYCRMSPRKRMISMI